MRQRGTRQSRPFVRCARRASVLVIALVGCGGAPGAAPGESPEPAARRQPPLMQPDLGDGAPEARAALASCPEAVWPADGSGEASHLGTHEGASVFQIAGSPPALVAVGRIFPEAAGACTVLRPVERAEPVAGAFWPAGGAVQAVLLRQEECQHDVCPGAVLLRDGERPLAARLLPATCDSSLQRLRWFAHQDSLQVTCRARGGSETVHVLHAGSAGIEIVFTLGTGSYEAATQEERETPGFCELRPVGWVRLVENGARPVIRALDPGRGQAGVDGKGKGLVADHRFDPATGRFEQITPGTLEDYDGRAWCTQ